MSKQLIISVVSKYGSAGHVVAEELAKIFQIDFFNSNLLDEYAKKYKIPLESLHKYDEKLAPSFFNRTVHGYSASPAANVAQLQFKLLRELAEEGKSFVILGRCSEDVLRKYSCMVSIFITANDEEKLMRSVDVNDLQHEKALAKIHSEDEKRRKYHDSYCKGKWGDANNYDIVINASLLGVEKTADILEEYIRARMKFM